MAPAPPPPLPVTEDTPPDMLAGSMDLRVVLPNGHSVKMSVERSTPMMDLLVQVTTLNKISTGGHVLQAIGERGILPYKPSTPIGALDTWTIQVVPKLKVQMTTTQKKAPLKPLNQQQPFEQTFRLQVHLPRNQLFVMRVSPRTPLSDILHLTCTEKNLDPRKYELRHPANLSQLLSPSCTLDDYGLHEVTLVARSRAPGMGSALSSSDIMALQREEDKRRQQARQQHGAGTGLGQVFNKQNRSSYCEGSISSDSLGGRSISPARSDESASRSASPQAPSLPPMMAPVPPARPARKRRPAPKPPCSNKVSISNEQQTESNVQAESTSETVVNGHPGSNKSKTTHILVSHSRNSSDSSGYHEASVLSESPADGNQISENCTLPRQGRMTSSQQTQMKAHGASHGLSRSMSSLSGVSNMAGCQHRTSNSSLASSTGQGQKKKKAPPPPPGAGVTKDGHQQRHTSSLLLSSTGQDITESINKTTSLERHMSGKSSVVASGQSPDKSSTLPGKMKMSQQDYRPVETSSQTSADTSTMETQSPEEMCVYGGEKTSEAEHASVPDIPEETSPIHSGTHQDELNNASKNQSSDSDISKTQDKRFQQFPLPPVETTPEPPVELASMSKTVDTSTKKETTNEVDSADEVEKAFRSVTVELEAAIKQDQDLNALPPPPTSASPVDDLAVDWEYQLPAPPSAFRDSDSPTLTEGRTVVLADSQVFEEPSLSLEPQLNIPQSISTTMDLQESLDLNLNSEIYKNNVTRINPLFDPQHFEDDVKPSVFVDGVKKFNINTKHVYYQEIESQKQDIMEQQSLNLDFLGDHCKETSTRTSGPGNREPVNFTISAYQRPFNKDSENNKECSVQHSFTGSSKITTGALQHKYSSTNSLNCITAGLSRTSSFNSSDITSKPRGPSSTRSVKRSTSYISIASKPLSHHGNYLQSDQAEIPYANRATSVGNLTAEAQLDRGNKRTYDSWGLRKTTSEHNVSQDLQECLQDESKSQYQVEEQKNMQVGREEQRSSQQEIVITEEDRVRLLALLQEQLQNSGLMQQQQLSQTQAFTADAPLQSLQVLRNILPQLNQTKVLHDNQAVNQQQKSDSLSSSRTESPPTKLTTKNADLSNHHSVKDTTSVNSNQQNTNEKTPNDKNTGEGKRYTYQGPPAINFATWSERPKSQVTIKMDRDYRIGIGQAGRMDERNETPAQTGNYESKDKTSVVGRNHDTETLHQSKNEEEINAQNKVNNKPNTVQQVIRTEPASLTMRLISHTAASGYRKPAAGASQKPVSSSYIAEGAQRFSTSEAKETTESSTVGLHVGSTFQQSDPSRVPIVRAVELKKSFIQQQNMHSSSHSLHRSSTMLNAEEDASHYSTNTVDQRNSISHHNGGSDDTAVQTSARVNFLAKKFSGIVSSSNGPPSFSTSQPVSSYGEVDTVDTKGFDSTTSLPYNSTLSYKNVSSTDMNASNVNTYQDARLKTGDGRGARRYTSVIGINSDSGHSLSSSFHEPAAESNKVQSRAPGPSVVRVNGFSAPKQLMPVVKGFQFASAAANSNTSPPSPNQISDTSAHHPIVLKSESASAIRSWKTVDTTDHPSSTSFGNNNTFMQKNSSESRQEPSIMKVTTNVESKPPPPPPQPVTLRKSVAQPRPKSLPAPQINPRDQLMDAIRNFGGQEKLKHVHDNG